MKASNFNFAICLVETFFAWFSKLNEFFLFLILSGSKLAEEFNEAFEGYSFHMMLSQFSNAKPLVEHLYPKHPKEKHVRK